MVIIIIIVTFLLILLIGTVLAMGREARKYLQMELEECTFRDGTERES